MKKVAIIGAGITGLTLAQELRQVAEITVFEKSRGVGGRMSTRYAGSFHFDHGVQFFTARTTEFQRFLEPHIDVAALAEWKGSLVNLEIGKKAEEFEWAEPHWVGSPNMNSFCKIIACDIEVRTNCEIAPFDEIKGDYWNLWDKNGGVQGYFDWVISTAPPKQTLRLFQTHLGTANPLQIANMKGCYSLMIGLGNPWNKPWIAARCANEVIQWISVNSSKPGRDQSVTCLIVHAAHEWTEAHMDDEENSIKNTMLEQFFLLTGIDARNAEHISLHRWRYAMSDPRQEITPYLDDQLCLAAVGDWCGHSRIENVWLKAKNFAVQLKDEIIKSGAA